MTAAAQDPYAAERMRMLDEIARPGGECPKAGKPRRDAGPG